MTGSIMRIIVAATILILSACSVKPPEGQMACTSDSECPDGWICDTDSLCYGAGDTAAPADDTDGEDT